MKDSSRICGNCTLCCKVIGVRALDKPPQTQCPNCEPGRGCKIYADRPHDCRSFYCMYVRQGSKIPDRWLPSRSHMVLCEDLEGPRIEVHVDSDHPDAWQQEPYYDDLRQWSIGAVTSGGYVMVYASGRTIVILPYKHVDFGQLDPETQIVYTSRMTRSGPIPDVELVTQDDPRFVKG